MSLAGSTLSPAHAIIWCRNNLIKTCLCTPGDASCVHSPWRGMDICINKAVRHRNNKPSIFQGGRVFARGRSRKCRRLFPESLVVIRDNTRPQRTAGSWCASTPKGKAGPDFVLHISAQVSEYILREGSSRPAGVHSLWNASVWRTHV